MTRTQEYKLSIGELNSLIRNLVLCEFIMCGNELIYQDKKKNNTMRISIHNADDDDLWCDGWFISFNFEHRGSNFSGFGSPYKPYEINILVNDINNTYKEHFGCVSKQTSLF